MTTANNSELNSAVEQVAAMMELAARTAPKTKGEDFIEVLIVGGDQLSALAAAMVKFGVDRGKANFDRDGKNVAESAAVILIGLKKAASAGLNCGACGFKTCEELETAPVADIEFQGPVCAYRMVDLGIALGSAVKTAQLFNVDNRVMYRAGAVARAMGLVDWDFVLGIPLAATGKNPFFDRK